MKKFLRSILLLGLVLSLGFALIGCSKSDGKKEAVLSEAPNGEEEEDHHHDLPFEWSGIFDLEDENYTIKFNKNEGDESILISFISIEGNIEDMEHHAAHVMEAEAIAVEKDGSFVAENEYTYNLALNEESSEFKLELKKPGKYYVFTEHLPEEFDMEILSSDGVVLKAAEPTEYESDHNHD